jgi:hypothetical protein
MFGASRWTAVVQPTLRREPFQVQSLTSFGVDAAGELYLATGSGKIYKLAR